ncbi:uncharacterized protein A1O9_12145 [Exophiala aquamarina CBS 119918]|uniref:CCHC-type domain-containing protein n=1 Tax=Exophiala aquamarina CBS 119918 TaxID=1182545 RepID=A0A072NXS6_9EURO|nr:uncharacterized protein A1O9_12145 [Exophiala aquamarina CBS 119918]KEF51808.1 hypothetical protein A1O9_12145 [Exophiala aquamarina CBS 119918]
MASSGFGNNRLATGFHKTRAILAEQTAATSTTSQQAPQSVASSPGNSADDAIEISDDEDSSSESGGMLLNVGNATNLHPHDLMAVDDESEMEEGETRDDEGLEPRNSETKGSVLPESMLIQSASQTGSLQSDLRGHNQRTDTSDPHGRLRLADLSQPELELQFRYIFSHLEREQVDLDRSAVCLGCLQEGHTQASCPERACYHCGIVSKHPARLCPLVSRCTLCRERGHTSDHCLTGIKVTTVPCDLCGILGHIEDSCPERFFPPFYQAASSPARVWVSCCHCASKSHYVGDCPELDQNFAPRWSMKSVDYTQIINLSLESNMRRLEREAESRGLRPKGLSIKGRAGMHHAGKSGTVSDDSSENDFIRPRIETSVRTHSARHNFSFRAPERFPPRPNWPEDTNFDRYNPSTHRNQRLRNDWYSTDSFGQRKSRSPSPGLLRSRRGDLDDTGTFRCRSRSPYEFDRSRADHIRARSPRVRAPSANNILNRRDNSKHSTQQPLENRPKDDIAINLPVRKGSTNANGNETQKSGNNRGFDGGQQSRQGGSMSRGAPLPTSMKKKSKQTKATARSNQA